MAVNSTSMDAGLAASLAGLSFQTKKSVESATSADGAKALIQQLEQPAFSPLDQFSTPLAGALTALLDSAIDLAQFQQLAGKLLLNVGVLALSNEASKDEVFAAISGSQSLAA